MPPTASTSGVKFSMFSAKSGFVIPKNKLSGSLVPTLQSGKAQKGGKAGNEHDNKQVQRKTKWGADLTQEPAVKKGRALAYQKRVDQITQQLESGTLEVETNLDSALSSQSDAERSLDSLKNSEMVEHLELERREAIGEILKLNPRYKAPPDYKPVMKEARVSIPVKEHYCFNFLNLILGSQGETLKQLEKETGAKIQIYGTKTGGEKVEISSFDESDIQSSWEELHLKVSADTYDKVDSTIAVIELLMTSVSGNLNTAADTSASGPGNTSSIPNNERTIDVNAELAAPQSHSQPHGSIYPEPSDRTQTLNSSAPSHGNLILTQEPANSLNPPPVFGLSRPPRTFHVGQPGCMGPLSTVRQSGPSAVMFRPDIVTGNMGLPARPPLPPPNFRPHPSGIDQPSFPYSPSINMNHPIASSMPMSGGLSGKVHANITSFPSINPPANTLPRPLQGDFNFQPQHRPLQISPFQPPPGNLPSQPFMQGFGRQHNVGRPTEQPPNHLPLFHGNPTSPNTINFRPPMPQIRPRNFVPGAHFPDGSPNLPPRPVFRFDNPGPSGPGGRQPGHQWFNGPRHQVYDPFSPSDA